MMFVLALLPVLIQVAVGQEQPNALFSKQPQASYVVRDGDSVVIECVPAKPAKFCTWKVDIPGVSTTGFLTDDQQVEDLPEIRAIDPESKTECSINITVVSSKYNGKYTCSPFVGSSQIDSTTAELIVAQKPVAVEFTDDQVGQREMTVAADEEVTIACEARDARPKADLAWYLGDRELFDGLENSDEVDEGSQLVTSRSVLRHVFAKEDDGAELRCEARHPGYSSQETGEAIMMVMVQYVPYRAEGKSLGTMYGFTADQEGQVTVNFTANPPPSVMVWTVGNGVEVGAGETSEDGRFSAGPLNEVAGAKHQYSLQLQIQPVKMEDQDVAFTLRTANAIGEELFDFRLGTGAAPPAPAPEGNAGATTDASNGQATENATAGIGGGAIAGIIIAVLLLLLIVALVAFARSRGKWCFAAKPSEAGAEASDTESAHDEKTDKPEKKGFKLSTLYSSLVSKKKETDVEAADKQDETDNLTAPAEEAGEDPPKKKEGEIVYAELVLDKDGLKTEVRPSPEKTEYAVIVGTKSEEEPAEKKE